MKISEKIVFVIECEKEELLQHGHDSEALFINLETNEFFWLHESYNEGENEILDLVAFPCEFVREQTAYAKDENKLFRYEYTKKD